MNYRASIPAALATSLALSGCLSLDAIPLEEARQVDAATSPPTLPGKSDDASTPPDGRVDTPDADVVEPSPDASLPDASLPDAEVPCVAGSLGPCRLVMHSNHGAAFNHYRHGDYVYWMEPGTTDALNNYNKDGAVVRVRVGEWQREEIASNLDLFHGNRHLAPFMRLFVQGNYVFWSWGRAEYGQGCFSDYRELTGGPSAYLEGGAFLGEDTCVVVNEQQYCAGFPDARVLRRRDLKSNGSFVDVLTSSCGYYTLRAVGQGLECQYEGFRVEVPSLEQTPPRGADSVIDTVNGRPVRFVDDSRIAIGTVANAGVEYRAVTESGATYLGGHGGFVYYGLPGGAVERIGLDGSDRKRLGTLPSTGAVFPFFVGDPLAATLVLVTKEDLRVLSMPAQ